MSKFFLVWNKNENNNVYKKKNEKCDFKDFGQKKYEIPQIP